MPDAPAWWDLITGGTSTPTTPPPQPPAQPEPAPEAPGAPAWWGLVGAPGPRTAPPAGGAPGGVEAQIRAVAARLGFSDPDLLVATARQESGLRPDAAGDYQGGVPQSHGVFQEHSRGRGAGVPVESRRDVAAATERAIAEFTAIRQRNPNADRGTWAALAQRPQDAQGYARSVNALLGPTGAGAPGAHPAPASATAAAPAQQAPAWWSLVAPSPGGAPRPASAPAPPGDAGVPAGVGRQAVAASWALSQLGSKAFYDACQRFIENAYGTAGRFGSAAAAGKALFKTADPREADVGDLVFFRPDASNGWSGHAAINLGGGRMVGATYAGVTQDNYLTNPYWRNLLVGFGDPPDQWQGRASGAEVAQGAQQLVGTARAAATPAGAAAGPAPAWWSLVSGGR